MSGLLTEDEEWSQLLTPFKVIRDAVHEDIWVTELETHIMDTNLYQRLHRIKQLGPTFLVFPCAVHTRFQHCLGAVHMAQEIMNAVQRNYQNRQLFFGSLLKKMDLRGLSPFPLTSRDIVLSRTAALLHDAAHIPFGHTLEKEGNVFKLTQWADDARVGYFFNTCNMRNHIESRLKEYIEAEAARDFVNELILVLRAIEGVDPETGELIPEQSDMVIGPEDDAISKLDHPYIGDIVGNTICADLLDYTLRDSYFTGLKLSRELRLVSNFSIVGSSKEDCRLALLLVRKGRKRFDALSSAVEFLRRRYYLAERVYGHRVKTSASAMIINALYAYKVLLRILNEAIEGRDDENQTHRELIEQLMDLGDDALISTLASVDEFVAKWERKAEEKRQQIDPKARDKIARARALITKNISDLRERSLYKPVYMIYSREGSREAERIREIIKNYRSPERRYVFQQYAEDLLNLKEPGSVILYVSRRDTGKAAQTRCLWTSGELKTLRQMGADRDVLTLEDELDTITRKYEELWRLYVFVDRSLIQEYGEYVSGLCKWAFIETNDVEDKKLAEARKLEPSEVWWETIPPETTITPKLKRQFFEEASRLPRKDEFKEYGPTRQELEKVFRNLKSEQHDVKEKRRKDS